MCLVCVRVTQDGLLRSFFPDMDIDIHYQCFSRIDMFFFCFFWKSTSTHSCAYYKDDFTVIVQPFFLYEGSSIYQLLHTAISVKIGEPYLLLYYSPNNHGSRVQI